MFACVLLISQAGQKLAQCRIVTMQCCLELQLCRRSSCYQIYRFSQPELITIWMWWDLVSDLQACQSVSATFGGCDSLIGVCHRRWWEHGRRNAASWTSTACSTRAPSPICAMPASLWRPSRPQPPQLAHPQPLLLEPAEEPSQQLAKTHSDWELDICLTLASSGVQLLARWEVPNVWS